jgi:hypothetical protein
MTRMLFPSRAKRALPRSFVTLGLAVAALGAGAASANAAGSSLYAEGLHISTGALVDPNGRTWVADHNAGFCRVTDPTEDGAGRIEHPEFPDQEGTRTCLGGLLPDAATGPDAAGQPTFFDPSPEFPDSGDELAFIPDGASPSSEVVRARWNPNTDRFEFLDTITMLGDRGRPVAVSMGPDENLYVVFQREDTIQRIVNPAGGVADGSTPTPEIVGIPADGRGPAAVAAGRDADGELAVYVAETTGLRVLRPDATTRPDTEAVPFDLPPLQTFSALNYDLARDLLWLGTADGVAPEDAGTDELLRVDVSTGALDTAFGSNFTMVGGIGLRPDGHVMVVDDPALLDPAEPLGMGRMFHVGLPAAHVTRGPLNDAGEESANRRFTRDSTPAFEVTGEGTRECRLHGPEVDSGWQDCPEGLFQVDDALADETYRLTVRSVLDGVTGLPESHAFTVDTQAPLRPVVVRPADGATVSTVPWYEFRGEAAGAFACRFDAEAEFTPCSPGRTRSFEEAGTHALEITVTDRAGNVSDASARVSFTVDPDLPPATPPGWGPGPTGRGSSLFSRGLHIPTGAIVDPNGRVWISDHNGGFCRVTQPDDDGAGTIEHPQFPGGTETRTCLGGLLPDAQPGPDAAGAPAFVDPTPAQPGSGDEVVLIPDGASPSSDVFRVRWNPDSGLFEPLDAVTMVDSGRGARPVAASLGPDGAVYVVFQREGNVQRISSPAGESPVARIVGVTSDGRGAAAVAAGRDAAGQLTIWVAEAGGLRRLAPNATTRPETTESGIELPVPPGAEEPVAAIGAMTYDLQRNVLWLGTANAATEADIGTDALHKVDIATGAVELDYAGGFTAVGGLGLRSDGILYVLDDPALVDPAEPLGMGRMYQVGLPAAHVARGPLADDDTEAADRGFIADTTPTFVIEGDEVTQCRLRGGPDALDTGWSDCPEGGRYTPATPLAEGSYLLTVRSVVGDVIGVVEAHRFTVDVTAPGQPRITSPANDALVSATPWFAFESEAGAAFSCRWDTQTAYSACEPGRTRTFNENGRHTLQIRATDRAGNVSVPSEAVAFDARGRITAVTIDGGPPARTTADTVTFAFSADAADVTFGCRLVGQPFTTCTSPRTFTDVPEGRHTFEVRGRDAAGNLSPTVRRTFTVDRTAPVTAVAFSATSAGGGADVTVQLSADEAATFRCRVDGQPFTDCGATRTFTGLAAGEHTFQAVATDDLGNESDVVTRQFVVEVQPAGAPAPQPLVVDVGSVAPLTLRTVSVASQVDLDQVQQAGLRVTVVAPTGTRVVRLQLFAAPSTTGGKRRLIATVHRSIRAGRRTITLTRRELRKLAPGRYRLEVRAGKTRKKLGRAAARSFTVKR